MTRCGRPYEHPKHRYQRWTSSLRGSKAVDTFCDGGSDDLDEYAANNQQDDLAEQGAYGDAT